MISIKNVKNTTYDGISSIYCGRGTPLGNPWPMKCHTVAERKRVIDLYEQWFKTEARRDPKFRAATRKLVRQYKKTGQLVLVCHCAPLDCHCRIIRDSVLARCGRDSWAYVGINSIFGSL